MSDGPPRETPRDRLLRAGPGALTDEELVEVLLRPVCRRPAAGAVARGLLEAFRGLDGLVSANGNLRRHPGIGPAQAAVLLAAGEITRRALRSQLLAKGRLVDRPAAVARYLGLRYADDHQEVVGALFLDPGHRLLGERELFRGTLDRSLVDPRVVFREALTFGASAVVLFHNHPSGDPSPSANDLAFTRRLVDAGQALGIALADHLILGRGGRWVSLNRRGAW